MRGSLTSRTEESAPLLLRSASKMGWSSCLRIPTPLIAKLCSVRPAAAPHAKPMLRGLCISMDAMSWHSAAHPTMTRLRTGDAMMSAGAADVFLLLS